MIYKTIVMVAAIFLLSGCAYVHQSPRKPALIGHIVFVQLAYAEDYTEILADSESMLSTIPSVVSFAAGQHIDTGRSSVLHDYDLAIYIGFDSVEGLASYVNHDQHIVYVTKWKPRLSSLRVYDMYDPND